MKIEITVTQLKLLLGCIDDSYYRCNIETRKERILSLRTDLIEQANHWNEMRIKLNNSTS